MELQIQDQTIYYQVQYSGRSKMSMELTPEGLITVKAPKKTDLNEIEAFLRKGENAKAILHLYQYLENRQYVSSRKEHVQDENYLYLGKAYPLSELPGFWDKWNPHEKQQREKKQSSQDSGFQQESKTSDQADVRCIPADMDVELELKKFYTKETKRIVKKRVKYFEKIIGVSAKSITVVESPGTWGTCNSYRELTFNYRISMAPPISIDYVVIHELCHIHHMNHDRSFWREVGSIDKDYKAHASFFDRYGAVMTI